MNTEIKFIDGKFVGFVNGKAVVKSTSKYYVQRQLDGQKLAFKEAPAPVASEFGINQRFSFVEQMVDMIVQKTLPSAVITGEGGLGKSYTVLKSLEKNGFKNLTDLSNFEVGAKVNKAKSYTVVKGYSTAKGLYRTLFENNGMVIVFDDCDSILKDDVAKNLLKGALDSYSKRYISWNADMRDDDLPRSFEFTGSIVFVSNMALEKIDQAIRTRSLVVDLSMTEAQKLERMEVIANTDEFLPEISPVSKSLALEFLKSNVNKIPNMSLRSLIAVTKIANTGNPQWKDLAKYVLTQGN
jgi:hypothetical protein